MFQSLYKPKMTEENATLVPPVNTEPHKPLNTTSISEYEAPAGIAIEIILANIFLFKVPLAVWIFGLSGNILSFMVFVRKSMCESLTGFLFLMLAVYDTVALQESLVLFFMLFGISSITYSTWTCRVAFWILDSAKFLAAWTLVAISMERFIGVNWPHKARLWCTRTKGIIFVVISIIVALALFGLSLDMYISFALYNRDLDKYVKYCFYGITESFTEHYALSIFPWLRFISSSLVPFIILLVLNLGIIIGLLLALRERQDTVSTGRVSDSKMTGEYFTYNANTTHYFTYNANTTQYFTYNANTTHYFTYNANTTQYFTYSANTKHTVLHIQC